MLGTLLIIVIVLSLAAVSSSSFCTATRAGSRLVVGARDGRAEAVGHSAVGEGVAVPGADCTRGEVALAEGPCGEALLQLARRSWSGPLSTRGVGGIREQRHAVPAPAADAVVADPPAAAPARRGLAGRPGWTVYRNRIPIGWTVFEIPSTPGCLQPVRSVLCGPDWEHLNPQQRRPRPSRAQPVAADLRWPGGSGEAATCSPRRRRWPAVARALSDVFLEVLHLLWPPARLVPVAQAMDLDAPPGLVVIRRC